VSANPTKIRFRRKALVRDVLLHGVPSPRPDIGATMRAGVVVRRPVGRAILVCRWVAVEGGRLECRWSADDIDGSSLEEPKSSLWVRIGRSLDLKRSRYRQAFLAVA
jgi:hypothetical protein